MYHIQSFLNEEDGIETVEVVLIMVILVALVLTFKDKVKEIVESAMKSISTNAKSITS